VNVVALSVVGAVVVIASGVLFALDVAPIVLVAIAYGCGVAAASLTDLDL
jgi:hypothetical protein